jgi:hypothetical protein
LKVKLSDLQSLADELADATKEFVSRMLASRDSRLATIEQRVKALEATSLPKWCGIWTQKDYAAGNLVTRSGSLWVALADTSDRPGDGGSAWRLVVKRGAYSRGGEE